MMKHLILALLSACFLFGGESMSGIAQPSQIEPGFHDFLEAVDKAQRELQNGKPAAFKALWSHSGTITLSGGFGGDIEKGWANVSKRLDWVGTQFTNGTNTITRLVTVAEGQLGYVIQSEHIEYLAPGQAERSFKDYRVTMIFRKENGRWLIVHRQADSNLVKQSP